MTHPCDQERHAAMAERKVISLAYTPELIERNRAHRLSASAHCGFVSSRRFLSAILRSLK
jgi:hypothetical protein